MAKTSVPARRLMTVSGGVALSMAIAACGSSNSSSPSSSGGSTGAADTSPYNILAIYGMTGDLEASAVAVNRGVQAAVDYFNSQGGVNGHKLVLTVKDDQSDPTKAVSILQDAVNSSSPPDDVIPGISSNEGLAMAPVLTRAQIVGLGSASSPALDDPTKYPYFFSQSTLAPTVVASGATFIASHPGVKSVAIVTSNDALGEADVPTLQSTFKAAGIATTVKLFDPTASDYTATYQAAAASHPDWVWMDGAGAEVPIMLSSRLKANLGNVPTVIGNVASSGSLTTYAKGTTQLDNTFATLGPMGAYVAPSDRGPELKAMLKALNEQGALAAPLFVYATGWDYVNYFVNGIQNLNGKDVTGPNLKTALETLPDSSDPQFPMYRPTFDTKTHNPQTPASLFSFGQEVGSKDGMIVLKKAYHSS